MAATGKNTFGAGQSKIINFGNYMNYQYLRTMRGFTIIIKVEQLTKPASGETGTIIQMLGRRKIGVFVGDNEKIYIKYLLSDGVTWSSHNTNKTLSSSYKNLLFGFFRNLIDPKNSVITYQINSSNIKGFIMDGKFQHLIFLTRVSFHYALGLKPHRGHLEIEGGRFGGGLCLLNQRPNISEGI